MDFDFFGLPIFSMSERRMEYSWDLKKMTESLLMHMLLLHYCKGNSAVNHWRGEAFGAVPHTLNTFKGTHRYPNAGFLKHSLYEHASDSIGVLGLFKGKLRDEGIAEPQILDASFFPVMQSVIEPALGEVCDLLAREKKIEAFEFYAILDKYGL